MPLAQIALRGSERAQNAVYWTRDEGARYGQAVTLTVTLGNLRGGQVDAGKRSGVCLAPSPFSAPQRDDGRVPPLCHVCSARTPKGDRHAVRGHDRDSGRDRGAADGRGAALPDGESAPLDRPDPVDRKSTRLN